MSEATGLICFIALGMFTVGWSAYEADEWPDEWLLSFVLIFALWVLILPVMIAGKLRRRKAIAIETRRAATGNTDAVEDESAGRQASPNPQHSGGSHP
jgi:hypothetical protein